MGAIDNDYMQILSQTIEEIKRESGNEFSLESINLSDLQRRTGISRAKLRRLKANGFEDLPHANLGKKHENTLLTGYSGLIDSLLRKGITNSNVIYERLCHNGFAGGKTIVKDYISSHKELVPAPRQIVSSQGNRGRRYQTLPGESFQMDWGFVNVDTSDKPYRLACFAMICHCCGKRYVEFFPNARQENLFIGMIHAFRYLGIPRYVLTDNMKSIVIKRDAEGKPVWQKDYEVFMSNVGFDTKLCKPYHPFTKGSVERLIRFVKDNFLADYEFSEITDLNYEALRWCDVQNDAYHKSVDCVPNDKHEAVCMKTASKLLENKQLLYYLCPERVISFDGFINYEGRRFGVPYWYLSKTCRVQRNGYVLTIYDSEITKVLTEHDVTWSRRDSFCKDQYSTDQPEEHETTAVKVHIKQLDPPFRDSGFNRFNFDWEGNE